VQVDKAFYAGMIDLTKVRLFGLCDSIYLLAVSRLILRKSMMAGCSFSVQDCVSKYSHVCHGREDSKFV